MSRLSTYLTCIIVLGAVGYASAADGVSVTDRFWQDVYTKAGDPGKGFLRVGEMPDGVVFKDGSGVSRTLKLVQREGKNVAPYLIAIDEPPPAPAVGFRSCGPFVLYSNTTTCTADPTDFLTGGVSLLNWLVNAQSANDSQGSPLSFPLTVRDWGFTIGGTINGFEFYYMTDDSSLATNPYFPYAVDPGDNDIGYAERQEMEIYAYSGSDLNQIGDGIMKATFQPGILPGDPETANNVGSFYRVAINLIDSKICIDCTNEEVIAGGGNFITAAEMVFVHRSPNDDPNYAVNGAPIPIEVIEPFRLDEGKMGYSYGLDAQESRDQNGDPLPGYPPNVPPVVEGHGLVMAHGGDGNEDLMRALDHLYDLRMDTQWGIPVHQPESSNTLFYYGGVNCSTGDPELDTPNAGAWFVMFTNTLGEPSPPDDTATTATVTSLAGGDGIWTTLDAIGDNTELAANMRNWDIDLYKLTASEGQRLIVDIDRTGTLDSAIKLFAKDPTPPNSFTLVAGVDATGTPMAGPGNQGADNEGDFVGADVPPNDVSESPGSPDAWLYYEIPPGVTNGTYFVGISSVPNTLYGLVGVMGVASPLPPPHAAEDAAALPYYLRLALFGPVINGYEEDDSITEATLIAGPANGTVTETGQKCGDGRWESFCGDFDFYEVQGDATGGQWLAVDIKFSGPGGVTNPYFNSCVGVYDSDGELIAFNDEDGESPDSILVQEIEGENAFVYVCVFGVRDNNLIVRYIHSQYKPDANGDPIPDGPPNREFDRLPLTPFLDGSGLADTGLWDEGRYSNEGIGDPPIPNLVEYEVKFMLNAPAWADPNGLLEPNDSFSEAEVYAIVNMGAKGFGDEVVMGDANSTPRPLILGDGKYSHPMNPNMNFQGDTDIYYLTGIVGGDMYKAEVKPLSIGGVPIDPDAENVTGQIALFNENTAFLDFTDIIFRSGEFWLQGVLPSTGLKHYIGVFRDSDLPICEPTYTGDFFPFDLTTSGTNTVNRAFSGQDMEYRFAMTKLQGPPEAPQGTRMFALSRSSDAGGGNTNAFELDPEDASESNGTNVGRIPLPDRTFPRGANGIAFDGGSVWYIDSDNLGADVFTPPSQDRLYEVDPELPSTPRNIVGPLGGQPWPKWQGFKVDKQPCAFEGVCTDLYEYTGLAHLNGLVYILANCFDPNLCPGTAPGDGILIFDPIMDTLVDANGAPKAQVQEAGGAVPIQVPGHPNLGVGMSGSTAENRIYVYSVDAEGIIKVNPLGVDPVLNQDGATMADFITNTVGGLSVLGGFAPIRENMYGADTNNRFGQVIDIATEVLVGGVIQEYGIVELGAHAPNFEVTTNALPAGVQGQPYGGGDKGYRDEGYQLETNGAVEFDDPNGDYTTWTVTGVVIEDANGTPQTISGMPNDLTLGAHGLISGTVTDPAGVYSFQVTSTDYNGDTASKILLLTIYGDCNGNGIPDQCDVDCGAEGCEDYQEGCGLSEDCQPNGVPDECDIAPGGASEDCNENLIPDECDLAECNGAPWCDDCNSNNTIDWCDIDTCPDPNGTTPECADCNNNGIPDWCDIDSGYSQDTNTNGVPDECEPQEGPCGPPPACDFFDNNGDGDIDIGDFNAFQTCYSGPGNAYPPGDPCLCNDANEDGDVDIGDFNAFQTQYTGPGGPCPTK